MIVPTGRPDCISRTWIIFMAVLSKASSRPSGEKAQVKAPGSFERARDRPVDGSQMRTNGAWSSASGGIATEASDRPSGPNATEVTGAEWPRRIFREPFPPRCPRG